jgi:hypothetical protein
MIYYPSLAVYDILQHVLYRIGKFYGCGLFHVWHTTWRAYTHDVLYIVR